MTPQQIEAMKLALEALERGLFKGELIEMREQAITALRQAIEQSQKQDAQKQDALRWRYTQQKGYFVIRREDCSDLWKVGVQSKSKSVNNSIQGVGNSLEEAIDLAITAHGIKKEKK